MPFIINYPDNTIGTDFFIGDIHDCYTALMMALAKRHFNFQTDRLFSVGDIIDRGPECEACLAMVEAPWFHPVLGNHEIMMIETVLNNNHQEAARWYRNGGIWWLDSANKASLLPKIKRMATRPRVLTVGQLALIHAEYYGDFAAIDTAMEPAQKMALIWGRTRIGRRDHSRVENIGGLVVGHTPLPRAPVVLGNTIYMDNGFWQTGGDPVLLSYNEVWQHITHPTGR